MNCFHSVNSGICIYDEDNKLLIDYFFNNSIPAWSDLPEAVIKNIETGNFEFSGNQYYLFTHIDPDHYDKRYLKKAMELYPKALVYGLGVPESNVPVTKLSDDCVSFDMGPFKIKCFERAHQGNPPLIQQRSLVVCVEVDSKQYIHCGDSCLDKGFIDKLKNVGIEHVDYLFVNLYHMISDTDREFIKALDPDKIYNIHLPYEKDDIYLFRKQLTGYMKKDKDPYFKSVLIPELMSYLE